GSGGKPRIYDFHRGANFNPNFLVCDDDGATFAYGGRFLTQGTGRTRPYVRYAAGPAGADGLPDAVHFIATEGHPRDVGNSIYAGVVRAGKVCGSDGKPVAALGDAALAPAALTRVFAGDADRRAWSTDIEVDAAGRPYAAFSVRHIEAGRTTLWFYYARWTGDAWAVHRLAHAGSALYAAENDYTGLVALDPHDPDFCVLSTNADPASGRPLVSAADGKPHHELFTARTADRGRTWTFVPLTADSRADNLRPVIPRWPPAANAAGAERRRAIVWMRGTYRTYADYDTDLVAVVQRVAAPRR
ncbi:MAG TPA: hypothetical protein VK986_24120, partial [Tepidisphaeraceae bacterium]|nr:hypothetical protein [Tepidisphaeraceae bacterium]